MKRKLWLLVIPIGLGAVLWGAHAAQSFGGFGGHHRGMGKEFLEYKLEKLSKELALDEKQKAKLDTFKGDIEAAMDQGRERRKEVHNLVKQEFAKENPDFNSIRPLIDQQIDATAQMAHQFVGRIGEFYNELTPEQKKKLRDHIAEKMEEHGHFD